MIEFDLTSKSTLLDSILSFDLAIRWALRTMTVEGKLSNMKMDELVHFFSDDWKAALENSEYDSIDDLIMDMFDDVDFIETTKLVKKELDEKGFNYPYESIALMGLMQITEDATPAQIFALIVLSDFDDMFGDEYAGKPLTEENFKEVISNIYNDLRKVMVGGNVSKGN